MFSSLDRSTISETMHINWIDNYSHFLKVQAPTGDSKAWRDCQWTVHALVTTRGLRETDEIDDDWLLGPEQVEAKIMPLDMFAAAAKAGCLQTLLVRGRLIRTHPDYFSGSNCKDVRTLPLKPPPPADAEQAYNETAVFAPLAVHGHNVSSNKGLARVFKMTLEHYEAKGIRPIIIMADVNIYKRLLKVCLYWSRKLEFL